MYMCSSNLITTLPLNKLKQKLREGGHETSESEQTVIGEGARDVSPFFVPSIEGEEKESCVGRCGN